MALGYEFAPRTTPVAGGETDLDIVGGATIFVHGIWFSSSSGASTLTLEQADGTHIHTFQLGAPGSEEFSIKFLADKGLQVTTSANGTAVIFHSQPGA